MAAMLKEALKPYARAWKYAKLYRHAARDARAAVAATTPAPHLPIAFVVACGRSGTSILGKVMQQHPAVLYHFEPYHLWAAIDPVTDMVNLYQDVAARCIMGSKHVPDRARVRAQHLLLQPGVDAGVDLVVEKTPINAMRIGYLESLFPGSRYVHIVRDGEDVVRSIHRLASGNPYRIAGKPRLNQWWGVGDSKWQALVRDCVGAGYWPDEVKAIADDDHISRGALEWLVSLREIDRQREALGERLFEFTYRELTEHPRETLTQLCQHLDIAAPQDWLKVAEEMISPERKNQGSPLTLRPAMHEAFNQYQRRFGFA